MVGDSDLVRSISKPIIIIIIIIIMNQTKSKPNQITQNQLQKAGLDNQIILFFLHFFKINFLIYSFFYL